MSDEQAQPIETNEAHRLEGEDGLTASQHLSAVADIAADADRKIEVHLASAIDLVSEELYQLRKINSGSREGKRRLSNLRTVVQGLQAQLAIVPDQPENDIE